MRQPTKSRQKTIDYNFTVIYEKQEDDTYLVTVPALPGCNTEGRTIEEAQTNAAEAIRSYVGSLLKHGESVPLDRFKNQFVGNVQVAIPQIA